MYEYDSEKYRKERSKHARYVFLDEQLKFSVIGPMMVGAGATVFFSNISAVFDWISSVVHLIF